MQEKKEKGRGNDRILRLFISWRSGVDLPGIAMSALDENVQLSESSYNVPLTSRRKRKEKGKGVANHRFCLVRINY